MSDKFKFRPLTEFELNVLIQLLKIDEPLYDYLREQLPLLWGAKLDRSGSFLLADSGSLIERRIGGSLPYVGIVDDGDGVPIQLAVFVDENDQLSAVEIIRLDGRLIINDIEPAFIRLQRDAAGQDIS